MKNILFSAFFLFSFTTYAQIITTVAGGSNGGYSGNGGPADSAGISIPIGVAVDVAGNLYIGDRNDNRIRKVDASGIITTIAGTGTAGFSGDNGPATAAEINEPYGITVDASGNVYFADDENSRVRKINTAGIITTIAGTGAFGYNGDNIHATAAELYSPGGVIVDGSGNVYITDSRNNRIRKVNTTGIITTIAGTGTAGYSGDNGLATAAELSQPYNITMDGSGNIYFTEYANQVVRKVSSIGIITTIAGTGTAGYSGDNGAATSAEFFDPCGIAIDGSGNIYVGDSYNNRVRKINPSGIITTIAGTGTEGFSGDNGPATAAELFSPTGVTIDDAGNIYFADAGNSRIRFITSTELVNTTNTVRDNIVIYPNPCIAHFTANIISGINEKVQVVITNSSGQKVKEFLAITNIPLDVSLKEPSGVYILTAITKDKIWSERVVVNK